MPCHSVFLLYSIRSTFKNYYFKKIILFRDCGKKYLCGELIVEIFRPKNIEKITITVFISLGTQGIWSVFPKKKAQKP